VYGGVVIGLLGWGLSLGVAWLVLLLLLLLLLLLPLLRWLLRITCELVIDYDDETRVILPAMGHRIAVEGSPAEDIRAAGCTAADTAGHTEAADRAGERDGLGIADQLLGGTGIVQPEAEEIERKEEDRRDIAGPDAAAEAASHSRTRAGSGSGPGSLAGPGFRTAAAGGIEGAGSSFWWCC
jgi:hypothetical protein